LKVTCIEFDALWINTGPVVILTSLHVIYFLIFKGLENSIREMDLSWNNLSILEKNIFSNLHDLQILRLSGNQNFGKISDIDPEQLM
jgi:hypothetical protein